MSAHEMTTTRADDTTRITRDEIDLMKRTVAAGTSDDELRLFVSTCERLKLDPFANQICCVMRWDARARREVMKIQVTIDGLRVIAQRTGEYEGQLDQQWAGADGVWRDVWLDSDPPAAARARVLRRGFRAPMSKVARWRSFVPLGKKGVPRMWQKMDDHMLQKCAEALALRAAFPHDLAGLYIPEEMEQAGEPAPVVELVQPDDDDDTPPVFADVVDSEPEPHRPIHAEVRAADAPDPRTRAIRLSECRDAGALRVWCEANSEAIIRSGPPALARVVAAGEEIGASPADVRAWLGVEHG